MFKIKFRSVRFFFISFFVVVLQSTIVNSISVYLVKPDMVLLLVIFFALYNGSRAACSYGICIGLCVDALSGGVMGINGVCLGTVGCICGMLKERVYINHFLTKFLVAFGAGILNTLIYYFLAMQFFRLPEIFSNLPFIIGAVVYSSICNILFVTITDRAVIERSTSLL